jgi:hypothetical protein
VKTDHPVHLEIMLLANQVRRVLEVNKVLKVTMVMREDLDTMDFKALQVLLVMEICPANKVQMVEVVE